jgi:lambda family phage portal protein
MGMLSKFGTMVATVSPFSLPFGGSQSPYTTTGNGPRSRRMAVPAYGPNQALDYSAPALRDQSRDAVRKNPLASAAVDRIVANAVGTGIKPALGAPELNKLWLHWTDTSSVDGVLDFYGQQAQVMRAVVESGECFIRLRSRPVTADTVIPLELEVLEAEFVPHERNEILSDGNIVRQGIEFDKDIQSKRVAYLVYPRHPADDIDGQMINEPIRVPADEMIHVFLQGRPGQIRGEPWMARILDRLMDLDAYQKAELVRKKTAASFVGFIRKITPDGMSIDDLSEIWGDASDEGGAAGVTLEPGTMQFLLPGEDVEFTNHQDLSGQYEIFVRTAHREIAAALGILYEQLSGDFSQVNDRTWRAAVQDFRRRCEMWQHHLLVFQFCRPVYRRWAELAVLHGHDVIEDKAVQWVAQAWPYINPVQDIEAHKAEIRAGFTSRAAVVAGRGEDIEEIDAAQAADNKRADKMGLVHDSDGRTSNGFGSPGLPLDQVVNSPAAEKTKAERANDDGDDAAEADLR